METGGRVCRARFGLRRIVLQVTVLKGEVVQTDVGELFTDAKIERHEPGFAFLQRLCWPRSVPANKSNVESP